MKRIITVTYTWEEILEMIKNQTNLELELQRFETKSTGDYDTGDFKQTITKFIFNEKIKEA